MKPKLDHCPDFCSTLDHCPEVCAPELTPDQTVPGLKLPMIRPFSTYLKAQIFFRLMSSRLCAQKISGQTIVHSNVTPDMISVRSNPPLSRLLCSDIHHCSDSSARQITSEKTQVRPKWFSQRIIIFIYKSPNIALTYSLIEN